MGVPQKAREGNPLVGVGEPLDSAHPWAGSPSGFGEFHPWSTGPNPTWPPRASKVDDLPGALGIWKLQAFLTPLGAGRGGPGWAKARQPRGLSSQKTRPRVFSTCHPGSLLCPWAAGVKSGECGGAPPPRPLPPARGGAAVGLSSPLIQWEMGSVCSEHVRDGMRAQLNNRGAAETTSLVKTVFP